MARGFVLGLIVAIAAVIAGGYLFVTSGALPAGQDAKPGTLERWAAKLPPGIRQAWAAGRASR